MTALDTMREFIGRYPDFGALDGFTVDYTDNVPDCAGLFPGGLVEIRRTPDIIPLELGGGITVESQYNFALYTVLAKSKDDDAGAELNAEWQMGFQEWVQRQSALGLAPAFGDEPRTERITAQNGAIYSADEEGTAMYAIQISVTFKKRYTKEALNG